jgi:hypothetical protein
MKFSETYALNPADNYNSEHDRMTLQPLDTGIYGLWTGHLFDLDNLRHGSIFIELGNIPG